jgi:hypothetical protein
MGDVMKTRDKLILIIVLLSTGILLFIFNSCSSSQELTAGKKAITVLIMPITKNGGVYFRDDEVWHNLVWSFESNGFNVVNNDSAWNRLVDDGYDLTWLTNAEILRISNNYNVGLIISRNAPTGTLGVFDCKEKKYVVYDDLRTSSSFDVRSNSNRKSYENRFATLVMKVRGLGY